YKPGPLFLKSSLVYRPETTTASVTGFSEKAPTRRSNEKLVIQETRRVRIGEIHYLDHPLLGVLVIVKRRN
ncbi:MAG: CsiV family protein, partial [Arenicellales bacterium]|nr:CsiV family protein [Arenicellales bacterium]